MNIQSNEDSMIAEEMRRTNGNISKVSRTLGIDYIALKSKFAAPTFELSFQRATGREPDDIRALGKAGFEQFVIAVKPAGAAWPSKYDEAIADARKKFDAGTHEMFQSNYQGWVIQYLMPRRHPRKPTRFFADMVVTR